MAKFTGFKFGVGTYPSFSFRFKENPSSYWPLRRKLSSENGLSALNFEVVGIFPSE